MLECFHRQNMLHSQILNILKTSACKNEEVRELYLKRLKKDALTRDENPESHFCAYFLPYNPKNKKVFIVHHKKSGLWFAPGGHIDKGETLWQTLNREIHEELGVENFFKELPPSFLFTITNIENSTRPCKTHFDIWFIMETNGDDFNIDPREFHDTKWLTIEEADKIIIDPANKKALNIINH